MRKRVYVEENHERWLVSYADFITLLFAFFVVLWKQSSLCRGNRRCCLRSSWFCFRVAALHSGGGFSSSTIDPKKMQSFAATFHSLLDRIEDPESPRYTLAAGLEQDSSAESLGNLRQALDELEPQFEAELFPELESGKVTISVEPRGLVLSLSEAALFAPGRAKLGAEARRIMRKVGRTLARTRRPVRLEGHTDDRPIRTKKYPSNWQLSTARAIVVLQFLVNESSLPIERLSAAGYGEYQPLAPNDSVQNRAKNRRVDIVVLTAEGPAR